MAFQRHDAHKQAKLRRSSYRKPRGLQNKMRLAKRGYRRAISPGFGAPRSEKRHGVVVSTLKELSQLDPKGQAAIIGRVGNRRRELLLREAKKRSLTVFNHDVDETLKRIDENVKKRKEERDARVAKKSEKAAKREKQRSEEAEAGAQGTDQKSPGNEEHKNEERKSPDPKAEDEKSEDEKAEEEKRKVLTKKV